LKNYIIGIVVGFLVLLAGFFIYQKLYPEKLPSNLIAGTGRIDGDVISLNTKYSGRIQSIFITEGQHVKKGEIIAVLNSDELKARLRSLEETVQASLNNFKALQKEYKIAEISIPLSVESAQSAVKIVFAQKEELLHSIENLNFTIEQKTRDYARTKTLFERNLVEKRALELSKLELDNTVTRKKEFEQKLKQSDQKIKIAGTDLKIAIIQLEKLNVMKDSIQALANQTASLKENQNELLATIDELTIKSPINGVVIEKVAQIGEVLSSGMVVATLIDPDQLYLKMFVDTVNNGKIKLNDMAVIFLDSFPDRPIKSRIVLISQAAEFTPKEVNVKSDRIQRVYSVRVKPDVPDLHLKLGLPAVGVITTDGKGLPKNSKIIGDL